MPPDSAVAVDDAGHVISGRAWLACFAGTVCFLALFLTTSYLRWPLIQNLGYMVFGAAGLRYREVLARFWLNEDLWFWGRLIKRRPNGWLRYHRLVTTAGSGALALGGLFGLAEAVLSLF